MEFLTDQDILKGCISDISQAQEAFVRRFFENIIEIPNGSLAEHSNPSFSHVAVEMARRAYPLVEKSEYPIIERFLVQNFSTKTHPRCHFLDASVRESIMGRVREGNRTLFREHIPDSEPIVFGYL